MIINTWTQERQTGCKRHSLVLIVGSQGMGPFKRLSVEIKVRVGYNPLITDKQQLQAYSFSSNRWMLFRNTLIAAMPGRGLGTHLMLPHSYPKIGAFMAIDPLPVAVCGEEFQWVYTRLRDDYYLHHWFLYLWYKDIWSASPGDILVAMQ
jgi:hypothetical protein